MNLHEGELRIFSPNRENKPGSTRKPIGKGDGFEPFGSPERGTELFVGEYYGVYAANMEFNKTVIERTLQLAHLDGKVLLTSTSGLVRLGKSENAAKKNNPYYSVTPVIGGWEVEINDLRLKEELEKKGFDNKKTQKTFVGKFNDLLKSSLEDCIILEKLSAAVEGKGMIIAKWIGTIAPLIGGSLGFAAADKNGILEDVPFILANSLIAYSILHRVSLFRYGRVLRNIDHFPEILMPPIEIDKVAESLFYLRFKGGNLVRNKVN